MSIKFNGLNTVQTQLELLNKAITNVEIRVQNDTPYSKFLGSKRFQLARNKNKWILDEEALHNNTPDIIRLINNAINIRRSVKLVGEEIGDKLIESMSVYPPATGNYIRTFRYRNSWRKQIK